MTKRNMGLASLLGALLFCSGIVLAQKPPQNINPERHGNLAAAQQLAARAYKRIVAAQEANEWDMDGHAQKAKDLLDQANKELKLAAEAANRNPK